jgi:PAB-dependent poly(A)-specific ribonuclease subunit 3
VSLGPELLVQELDSHMAFNDGMADQLARECENGRLFRLAARLCTVVDRPEGDGMDHQWSETGGHPRHVFRPQTLFGTPSG